MTETAAPLPSNWQFSVPLASNQSSSCTQHRLSLEGARGVIQAVEWAQWALGTRSEYPGLSRCCMWHILVN
jgi:hypothetical protein